jgi:hypothetical protein
MSILCILALILEPIGFGANRLGAKGDFDAYQFQEKVKFTNEY